MMASVVQNESVVSGIFTSKVTSQRIFEKVENVSDLEPILRERLPISTNIFNICRNQTNWSDVRWFVLGGEVSSNSWIVSTYFRDDRGLEISVSRPADASITSEIREAFFNASFIDWKEAYMFAAVDIGVSEMITDISVRDKGNYTHVDPNNLYYMEIEDGLRLSEEFNHGEGFEVKSLDSDEGKEFLLSTWTHASEGSDKYLTTLLARNPSTGVYVNGKIVSGSGFTVHGVISMLHTLSDYRGKGYARANMHLLMKRVAEKGLIPSCTVAQRNEVSKAFQLKIGFKLAGTVDFVIYEKSGF